MTRHRITVLALLAIAAGACSSNPPAVRVSDSNPTLNTSWHANLASPASLAGAVQMNGSASMAPDPNGTSTNISLDLANASPGGLHPWGVHSGQCGNSMGHSQFGPSGAYAPLQVSSEGRAVGTATVAMETPKAGSYFVVVYASEANSSTVVACGNLAPPTQ